MTSCVTALVVAAVVALPVGAAIKAMNLGELMSITDDAVYGTIVKTESIRLDAPWPNAVYTQITVQGESLRSGESGRFELVFHGSHDRADDYVISEMPALQDVRLGGETVVFFEANVEDVFGKNVVHNWGNLYRVERVFGAPVVLGKGEGSAFELNAGLQEVRTRVSSAHAAILVSGKKKIPGLAK
ncbi:MAG: hypothetical protein DRQ55_11030 [Planctomycetota bacterium]|nr:MAG: hypothetical protein DRQ55_11030 [Planctomycetota bacterium]